MQNRFCAALLPFLLPLSVGEESPAALAAGLDAIRADHIRADVYFFADDQMRGRDTPSAGLRVAARFLRARVEGLGFEPAGGAAGDAAAGDAIGEGWFHTFEVHQRRVDPERSGLLFEVPGESQPARELVLGEDYFIDSYRQISNHSLTGGLVFCGEAAKKELEDIRFEDSAPRWALCQEGSTSVQRMIRTVERAGAIGLVIVPASQPDSKDGSPDEDLVRTTGTVMRGSVSLKGSTSKRRAFPTVFLSASAAEELFLRATPAQGSSDWRPRVGQDLGLVLREERVGTESVQVENVAALWPGSDPTLRDEVILLSAHYDHVGAREEEVWNGADDNASGSMALVAVAEGLAAYGPMRRSVLLLWVSGEEKGLWGSDAWTKSPVLPEGSRALCDLNLDMVGRNATDELAITPTREHVAYNGLTRLAERLAPLEGFPELDGCDEFWSRSDHANFYENLGLPVAFLHAGEHEDYHMPSDTPDKLDYDKIERVSRLVLRMLDAMQADSLDL